MTDVRASNAISSIEASIRRLNRREFIAALRPGVDAETVARELSLRGLSCPDGIAEIYGWHDGTNMREAILGLVYLLPGYFLLSLEDALATYDELSHRDDWPLGAVPILADGGGYFFLVQTDLSPASSGQVIWYMYDESESPVAYESVTDLLVTIAAGYEQDVFVLDKDRYLEMDSHRFWDLAATLNPSADVWI